MNDQQEELMVIEAAVIAVPAEDFIGPPTREALKKAVALQYSAPDTPTVIAKGEGVLAEKIIEAASEHGIFIEENPLMAEALGAVELNDQIPEELYTAVAEVIGFVLSLKGGASPPIIPSKQRG